MRRDAREWALQALFQLDLNPRGIDQALRDFYDLCPEAKGQGRDFAEFLIRGVHGGRDEIDRKLTRLARNWNLKRMGVVERNVLRMALFEMENCNDIPPVVTINEAVDIAKYYSHAEAGRFVNGILDRIARELKRPAREPAD